LTGGPKAAWFFIGFLLGIPGILLAYVTNIDKFPKVKSDALKFSAIGYAVTFAISFCLIVMYSALIMTVIGSAAATFNTW
jgi:hypothetical protein